MKSSSKKIPSPDEREGIADLYGRVIHLAPEMRARFLAREAVHRPAIVAEVERLLSSESAGNFLEAPAMPRAVTLPAMASPTGEVPDALGPYRIVRHLSTG